MIKECASTKETRELAMQCAKRLKGSDVLALHGELGAGKTTFTQGIAHAFGMKQSVPSPTFTVLQLYQLPFIIRGVKQLAHIDTYRLKNAQEGINIGMLDYLHDNHTLTIIEWPELINDLLPPSTIHIFLKQKKSTCSIEIPDGWAI